MNVTIHRGYVIVAVVFALLLIPFIAMKFTSEVNWGAGDFFVAALLLLTTGFTLDWIKRRVKSKRNSILLIGMVLLALLLVWVELAVGLFGSPIAGS